MTRKVFIFWMLGAGLAGSALLVSKSGTAQQKPDAKKQQALNSALIHAIPKKDSKSVLTLLEKGADPNAMDGDGRFPLLIAVENRSTALVRLLLKHGAQVNKTWVHGITPLHIAVDKRDIPTVSLLLANGSSKTARSAFDDPAHPLAEQVRELLKRKDE